MRDVNILSTQQRLKLFEPVLEFMSRCGVTEAVIRSSFDAALADLQSSRTGGRLKSRDDLHIKTQNLPAQLLRAWHRDSRYIDHEAKPRPLHLTKGGANLSAVIRRIDASADPSQVVRSMKAVGLIRRTSNNRYVPTSETAIVDKLHPLAVEHVTKLVNRLVSTVSRNTNRDRDSLTLIDRHAYTADLNSADRVAFAEFTRSHGMAYLEAIDDWLEQRRVRRRPGSRAGIKGVAAGVYLFAYLGDEGTVSVKSGKESSLRLLRSGGPKKQSAISQSKRHIPIRAARA
jgi:hypothetical protein